MSGELRIDIAWKPPGPIAAKFMASTAMVQILNGPIGSGKTTAVLMKGLRLGAKQAPSRKHRARNSRGELVPVRRFKLAVVRDTYRQLWKTTLPSWFRRVPKEVGEFNGAENAPAAHRIGFELDAGSINSTIVDFQAEFAAIGEMAVEDFMRGYEPTCWYLNELDLLAQMVLAFAQDRAGRFPEMDDGGPTWRGVLADCNAPEFEAWLYREIFALTPAQRRALNVDLFVQPGGREPGAENLENLPPDYYTPKIGQEDWYIARMIDNKPGYSRSGKPIYPEFNDRLHVAPDELEPVPGLPIGIGLDAGGSPAAVIGQRLRNGQRRVLDEIVTEQGTGPGRFGEQLRQLLHDRYGAFLADASIIGARRAPVIRGWADPSAAYGADKDAGDEDWMQIVARKAGIRIEAAPTNAPRLRWEAVRRPLQTLIDGAPAFLLSPRCTTTRAGFNNGYRFRKLNVPGATRYGEEAEKNEYSHVHDALQYWCSGDDGYLEVMERNQARVVDPRMAEHQHDWDPLGGER